MSVDILEKIIAKKQVRLNEAIKEIPLKELWRKLEQRNPERRTWPLVTDDFNVISEVKHASPSLGPIPWQMTAKELVKEYEQGGAAVISVLTEEDFFRGGIKDLQEVRETVSLPILRKDFMWTEYQLVESRLIGADAVLLIVAMLEAKNLGKLLNLTSELGLEALVECHDRCEVEQALEAGATLIGLNNRNLRTFEVRLETTLELMEIIPKDYVVISESGIRSQEDAGRVAEAGANGVLVGESCVKHEHPALHVANLREQGRKNFRSRV